MTSALRRARARSRRGAAAALAVRDADLGLEIGMFGQAAFEHVAQLLLAQRPRALGALRSVD
jgi:hypothetical protein